jgi:hypothetical protein
VARASKAHKLVRKHIYKYRDHGLADNKPMAEGGMVKKEMEKSDVLVREKARRSTKWPNTAPGRTHVSSVMLWGRGASAPLSLFEESRRR